MASSVWLVQMFEVRVARAEIVERHAHACAMAVVDECGHLGVVEDQAFGDFELELRRRDGVVVDLVQHAFDEIGVLELPSGDSMPSPSSV